MKFNTAHPVLVLACVAVVCSLLLPAVLEAVTASRNLFIGSLEIRDRDGIHIHHIALALVWPAFGIANFISFSLLASLIVFAMRRTKRQRVNRIVLIFGLVWCLVIGVIVVAQTPRIG